LPVDAPSVLLTLATLQLIPLVLAGVVRRVTPDRAVRLGKVATRLATILLVALVAVAIVANAREIMDGGLPVVLAVAAITIATLVVGLALGGPRSRDRTHGRVPVRAAIGVAGAPGRDPDRGTCRDRRRGGLRTGAAGVEPDRRPAAEPVASTSIRTAARRDDRLIVSGERVRPPRPYRLGKRPGARCALAGVRRALGFDVRSDEVGNVVAYVPDSPGAEAAPVIVLQAHLDIESSARGRGAVIGWPASCRG
jgi:hypothetical protein